MPKKPTGRVGPIQVTITEGRADLRWENVKFPTEKKDIEQLVVNQFMAAMSRTGAQIKASQNSEDDLDFTLILPGGKIKLELREAFYGTGANSPPYDSRDMRIKSFSYAEQIVAAVRDKSHYGTAMPIHLLLYITHWRFLPSETTIRLAQYLLQQARPMFENVFFLSPIDPGQADLRVLYPSNNPLQGKKPEEFRDQWYLNLDPANWQLQQSR
ncbi:MAG TPA: hypothetical protein VLX09_23035 [Stellaceae bacterium]|nr:hypothetical protein [Stellaceae bacterium]